MKTLHVDYYDFAEDFKDITARQSFGGMVIIDVDRSTDRFGHQNDRDVIYRLPKSEAKKLYKQLRSIFKTE